MPFKEDQDSSSRVIVQGITRNFGFHPERLKEQRELISAILAELPAEFKKVIHFLTFVTTRMVSYGQANIKLANSLLAWQLVWV